MAIHGIEALDGAELLVGTRGAHLAFDPVALTQVVAANHALVHIGVAFAWQVALRAHETIAVGKDVQDALHVPEALALHEFGEHGIDEVGL